MDTDSLVKRFAADRRYSYSKRGEFYILKKGQRSTVISFGDECLFLNHKDQDPVSKNTNITQDEKIKKRTQEKIEKNKARNRDRLIQMKSQDEKKINHEKRLRLQEQENDFVMNFYVKDAKLIFVVRIRDPKNIDLVLSEANMDKFVSCGYVKMKNYRVVQYIGYSFLKSEVGNVICGDMDEQGCAYGCSCHVPPIGPRYHVILTKKVPGNFDEGFVYLHYPNGTQQNKDEYRYSLPIYDPYVIKDSKRYDDSHTFFQWGGEESFLEKGGDNMYIDSYHNGWDFHRSTYF